MKKKVLFASPVIALLLVLAIYTIASSARPYYQLYTIKTLPINDAPYKQIYGLASNGNYVWTKINDTYYKFDPKTMEILSSYSRYTRTDPDITRALAWDGDSLLVSYDDSIKKYNADWQILASYNYPPYNSPVYDIAWDDDSPGGPYIWYCNMDGQVIKAALGANLQVVETIDLTDLGYFSTGIAWDGQNLLLGVGPYGGYPAPTDDRYTWVLRYDPVSKKVLDEYTVPQPVQWSLRHLEWVDDPVDGPSLFAEDFQSHVIYQYAFGTTLFGAGQKPAIFLPVVLKK